MQPLGASEDDVQRVLSTLRGGGRDARVAIMFSGRSCRACAAVKAGLRAGALGRTGTVFEASVDENADLADAYRVRQTPTLVVLSPTKELGRVTATTPEPFNDLLARHAAAT
jgi:hypothetical protein